jgi:ribosomal protein S18 acetylase RimI-like enzyme
VHVLVLEPSTPSGSVWTLEPDEAALVYIITAESHRGRGFAPIVTQFAAAHLQKHGYRRMYAWIWHDHRVIDQES